MARELLLGELGFLHANVKRYLAHYPDGQDTWSPAPNLRSLFSRAGHMAGIPHAALAVLEGRPDEEVFAPDQPLERGGREELTRCFDEGMARLRRYLEGLSDDDFRGRPVRDPFTGTTTPQAVALGAVAHLYHHRGQLHNYLKELGAPVSTDTLYER